MSKRPLFLIGGIGLLLAVAHVLYFSNGPIHFQSPAVSGTVVDSQTGQPLPGVTVKVRWSVMRSTANMHDPESRELSDETATTDTNGFFTVPAWGPVTLEHGWFYFSTDPEVTFSRNGQDLGQIYNRNQEGFNEITPSAYQTVTYELPSWNGTRIQRP